MHGSTCPKCSAAITGDNKHCDKCGSVKLPLI